MVAKEVELSLLTSFGSSGYTTYESEIFELFDEALIDLFGFVASSKDLSNLRVSLLERLDDVALLLPCS